MKKSISKGFQVCKYYLKEIDSQSRINSSRGCTMRLFKWGVKLSLTALVIFTVIFSFTYASILVPISPRYIDWEEPSPIYDKDRPIYVVEGILIREYKENRIVHVPFEEMPDFLPNAFVAIEDNRFYHHPGFDVRGILRAFAFNAKNRELAQGASTITQQLARNIFLNHDRTAQRKLLELAIAIELERRYTKEEIFEMYLNQIYFGAGNYGVEKAAQNYFGTNTQNLKLGEAAMLAGIIKAPSFYSPHRNLDLAKHHQQIVLNQMVVKGFISVEDVMAELDQ